MRSARDAWPRNAGSLPWPCIAAMWTGAGGRRAHGRRRGTPRTGGARASTPRSRAVRRQAQRLSAATPGATALGRQFTTSITNLPIQLDAATQQARAEQMNVNRWLAEHGAPMHVDLGSGVTVDTMLKKVRAPCGVSSALGIRRAAFRERRRVGRRPGRRRLSVTPAQLQPGGLVASKAEANK